MKISDIETRLTDLDWITSSSDSYGGVEFDLVGRRKFFFTQWSVLVRFIPVLDRETANVWDQTFLRLSKAAKSWTVGECFLLCLVTSKISLDIIPEISQDKMGLFGILRLKGGGGRVIIVSRSSKQVYGQVPRLPYDMRKFSSEIIDAFRLLLSKEASEGTVSVLRLNRQTLPPTQVQGNFTIFLSYSRKDEMEAKELLKHLKVIERIGQITIWSDKLIGPGENWDAAIEGALSTARIAILLVTAHSLTSDYILSVEIPRLLMRVDTGQTILVPVIGKPCAWRSVEWLTKFNVLPRSSDPVWNGRGKQKDVELALIAEEIAALAGDFREGELEAP